jgi:hypothetical protein
MPVTSLGGSKYLATFLDDYSKLSIVRPITHKSDTAGVVREVIQLMETQSGQRCRAIRTDNGTEYVNQHLASYLKAKGIIHQTTIPYNPAQNGSAERLNRTLMERARAMLTDAGLPWELWAEAAVTANYIRCRSPVAKRTKTPWELFFGSKPDVSMLRVFGSRAYAHVPKEKRHKLHQRSIRGVLVGYAAHSKGYRILLDDKSIILSRDVIFDENVGAASCYKEVEPNKGFEVLEEEAATDEETATEPDGETTSPQPGSPTQLHPTEQPTQSGTARYPARERHAPREWWKESVAMAAIEEPKDREEALSSKHAAKWQQAMDEEMASLMANQTWTLEELPADVEPIPVKWVYKVKTNADGSVERFKARHCG